MSSKLFIVSIVVIYLSVLVSGRRRCDSEGKCKYGGTCGSDGMCRCSFKCSPPTWDVNRNSIYCIPPKGSRGLERFPNICYLMARACELQEDLPLIKMDFTKPKSKRCQAQNTERWHLCPKPEDFMGPCGGTLSHRGRLVDGGVCLQDKRSKAIRCECPSTRVGENCQQKFLELPFASIKAEIEEKPEDPGQLAVIIVIASAAGVFLGLIIFASLRYRAEGIRGDAYYPSRPTQRDLIVREEMGSVSKATGGQTDNREDTEVHDHSEEQYEEDELSKNKNSLVIEIDAEINTRTPRDFATAADISCPPRRQRLNGHSANGRKVGDSNNNHSSNANTGICCDDATTILNESKNIAAESSPENGHVDKTNRSSNARSKIEVLNSNGFDKASGSHKSSTKKHSLKKESCNKSTPSITNKTESSKHQIVIELSDSKYDGVHTL